MQNRNMRTFSSVSSQGSFGNAPSPVHAASSAPGNEFPPTASPFATSRGGDVATSPERTQNKCATVTMMLAKRIIRNAWSVEDEHFFEPNHMNVWQTLEFLSGITLRKRYNYEGYNDTNNTSVLALTPSWRRDSFVEKNVSPNIDESTSTKTSGAASSTGSAKYAVASGNVNASSQHGANGGGSGAVRLDSAGVGGGGGAGRSRGAGDKRLAPGQTKHAKKAIPNNGETRIKAINSSVRRKRRGKQKLRLKDLDTEYALSPSDYADLIKCTFNLPRISAALERLMGTNVVRLTDRNYMKELRERIEDDYRQNLQKRIKARELKEVERERILIIEGKTKVIPDELADDPIFVVDKKADLEISKARAKLKTNREKNSDRLKLQGVKWERERLQHEEEEAQRIDQLRQRFKEQHDLEEHYTEEDATKGMKLLRIHDEDWRPCEQRLKEFLEQERAKMKERSVRIPTPFTSDAKDMQSILRARKRFQETELRIRSHIDEQLLKQQQELLQRQQKLPVPSETEGHATQYATSRHGEDASTAEAGNDPFVAGDETSLVRKNVASDDASDVSSGESFDEGSTVSMAKQRYAHMLQQELENDVAEGLLISKDQYDHLRYEDEKIMQLKNARDIRELYQLAEDIIIGERVESYADEEEAEEEEVTAVA